MLEVQENVRSSLHSVKSAKTEPRTPRLRDWNSPLGGEDPDGVLANVAQCIEQLRSAGTPPYEKETVSKQLFLLADKREDFRFALGSHSQAIPLLVSLLRSGTVAAKINAAATLGVLCREDDLRIKVLLGGCIPPLLSLLRISSLEAQTAAANTIHAVTQGGFKDHVGSKIFSTEGVVPSLWEQLQPGRKLDSSVYGLLTGSLRNLCNNTDGFWKATLSAGGVDILVGLLRLENSVAQSNACSLLASLMTAVASSSARVLNASAVTPLLKLLASGNEVSVRAEAAGALQALSANLPEAGKMIANAGGISKLIGATVAPSKEFMQGEFARLLQENAMGALANISHGAYEVNHKPMRQR